MTSLARQHEQRYTWEDYRRWSDKERWEIIDGEAFAMAPSPAFRHQDIALKLASELSNFFKGKNCRPIIAPFDVKLSDTDVLQPDLMVVCDPEKLKETHVARSPKIMMEIVSPSSESRDRLLKMKLYEKYGVQEYWIVTPFPPLLEIFFLDESGKFHPHSGGTQNDTITSPSFPELKIKLSSIFDITYTQEEQEALKLSEARAPYSA